MALLSPQIFVKVCKSEQFQFGSMNIMPPTNGEAGVK